MGWSLGFDTDWDRDIGYGVPAVCDHPGCNKKIDRGLAYVCGGEPYGGGKGCGLFFCGDHLGGYGPQLCARCSEGKNPFRAKPDVAEWIRWKLTHSSWKEWRENHKEEVKRMKSAVQRTTRARSANK